jgi:hypothetical protein
MTGKGARSLERGELEPLADLIGQLGLTGHFSGDAVMYGSDPVIRSPHRLGEASCTALLLAGVAGAAIWEIRGGTPVGISRGLRIPRQRRPAPGIPAVHSLTGIRWPARMNWRPLWTP